MHLIHVESQSVVLVSELNVLPLLKQNTNYTDYIFRVKLALVLYIGCLLPLQYSQIWQLDYLCDFDCAV